MSEEAIKRDWITGWGAVYEARLKPWLEDCKTKCRGKTGLDYMACISACMKTKKEEMGVRSLEEVKKKLGVT